MNKRAILLALRRVLAETPKRIPRKAERVATDYSGYPMTVRVNGKEYWGTSKMGTRIRGPATGAKAREYRRVEDGLDDRTWATRRRLILGD